MKIISKTNRPYRLVILIPSVWAIRNIVHSGVLQALAEAGVEVHLLMRHVNHDVQRTQRDYQFAAGLHEMIPVTTHRFPGKALLGEVTHSAFMQSNRIVSYPIYSRWYHRKDTPGQRIRSDFAQLLGRLSSPQWCYNRLAGLNEALYRASADITPLRRQLEQIAPDLVWSTTFVTHPEHGYVVAAKNLQIPVLASVLSFDNLTSRTAYLYRFDHYTVWSEWMKQQLARYYQVPPEKIIVTGTAQFDFHRRGEYCLNREDTLNLFGLSPDSRYFVYGTSAQLLTPDEPRLVGQIAQKMAHEKGLEDYKLIVRLHPLDDWARWKEEASGENTVFSGAWGVKPDADGWAFITPDEQVKLVSLLTHADACINIASTLGLDTSILDRPVIGIDFRNESSAPQELLYEEYYTEHYLPLMQNKAVVVAKNWEELMQLLQEAIAFPGKYKEGRQRAVEDICGSVDGNSTQRLVAAVLNQLALTARI